MCSPSLGSLLDLPPRATPTAPEVASRVGFGVESGKSGGVFHLQRETVLHFLWFRKRRRREGNPPLARPQASAAGERQLSPAEGRKEEKTILVGHRRGGAEGQRVNSACNMQHIFVG